MSTNEEQLQKLKVTELKELLAKHHLVQTGKKDELVKRLVDNHVQADGSVANTGAAQEEELVEPPAEEPAPAAAPTETTAPATEDSNTAPSTSTPTAPAELTPEQQALKARAERFGLPFDPSASASARSSAPAKTTTAEKSSNGNGVAEPKEKKEKAGAIDKTSLGLSEEVLAKRAAKFGLPEKKAEPPKSEKGVKPPSAKAVQVAQTEITPEMAEKIAAEEEKRRKRAEKFGTGTPAAPSKHAADGSFDGPDAKKAKV